MTSVMETYGKYERHLKSERRVKHATFRKVRLSLTYFAELYGDFDTMALNATDLHTFYHRLKSKRSRKAKKGDTQSLGSAHIHKILAHVKAYVKWLSDKALLGNLLPGDVPSCKITEHRIAYLTKQELTLIVRQLENEIAEAHALGDKRKIYSAYLRHAIVRMLYTSGLRNMELRSLTAENLNIPELYGSIIGKGDKFGIVTFSEFAAKALVEYLSIREQYFPGIAFRYIFTLYEKKGAIQLTEQKLNIGLKQLAQRAGIKQNVYAHLFRHTLATHLLQDGRTIVDVQRKLRHSSISVTAVYVHSDPQVVKSKTKSLGVDLMQSENLADENDLIRMMHALLLQLISSISNT